ncbi:MAG: hypothetical protein JWO95_2524, partial [Verrucomicrobiales bacterium]|nr:hypothetical protein [Verrucomicrobiales bacterium]
VATAPVGKKSECRMSNDESSKSQAPMFVIRASGILSFILVSSFVIPRRGNIGPSGALTGARRFRAHGRLANQAVNCPIYMAKRDFMPRQDSAALVFHDVFTNEMVANGAALGFSPAEIAELRDVTVIGCAP